MQRILVVVRGPVDVPTLRSRCMPGESGPAEIAVCYVLEPEEDALEQSLRAQKRMTTLLRQALGEGAESVAVFVASERDGNTVADYAREWGATFTRA